MESCYNEFSLGDLILSIHVLSVLHQKTCYTESLVYSGFLSCQNVVVQNNRLQRRHLVSEALQVLLLVKSLAQGVMLSRLPVKPTGNLDSRTLLERSNNRNLSPLGNQHWIINGSGALLFHYILRYSVLDQERKFCFIITTSLPLSS